GSACAVVEYDFSVVGDGTLQRLGIADEQTVGYRRATAIGVCAAQDQRAAALLGQRAVTPHGAGVGTVCALLEYDFSVVGNLSLQGLGITGEFACGYRRAAAVVIIPGQKQSAAATFAEMAVTMQVIIHVKGVTGIGNVECAAGIAPDDSPVRGGEIRARHLQRAAVQGQVTAAGAQTVVIGYRQRAVAHHGAAAVAVLASQFQRAGASLAQAVTTGEDIVDRGSVIDAGG